jgi:hypothetical protein
VTLCDTVELPDCVGETDDESDDVGLEVPHCEPESEVDTVGETDAVMLPHGDAVAEIVDDPLLDVVSEEDVDTDKDEQAVAETETVAQPDTEALIVGQLVALLDCDGEVDCDVVCVDDVDTVDVVVMPVADIEMPNNKSNKRAGILPRNKLRCITTRKV